MNTRIQICRLRLPFIAIASILAVVTAPTAQAGAAPLQDPKTATLLPRPELGWPRAVTTSSGARLLVYQPQVSEWIDQKLLKGLAVLSYQASGAPKPELGTVAVETTTKVSVAERLVSFSPLRVTETNFPTLSKEATKEIIDEIALKLPAEERIIALDRVLAQISKSELTPKNAAGIKSDPPVILFSSTPAVLVSLDGDPIWSPIRGNDLRFAVNTNWDLFQHEPTGQYYLRFETVWLKAATLEGPWVSAGRLPDSFAKLPNDDNWKDVLAALPGKPAGAAVKVFVTTEPTELIVTTGAPMAEPVAGTNLLWVNNTESDLFRAGKSGPYYYLVTGRWFTAATLAGPWTFATTSLPADFKKIPRGHLRSRVLASVPGSDEANEAILLANVPQTARVDRNELKAPEVAYQGDPEFAAIPGTSVARATNTGLDVIKVGDVYYMCNQGVWFLANSPTGPWTVASSVPGQIYEIPADSPAYNVTYVKVEEDDDDDDEWVNFACYAGYTGLMVAWGCAVWGTGWYYPSYVWRGVGGYPVYYPYARTYGYAAAYNPWTGSYGAAGRIYGPYGGAAYGARYNAATGTYARGAMAYGPYGARGAAAAYNPRTGTAAATRQGSGVYGSWGTTAVQRGDSWAQTSRVTNNVTGKTTRVTQTDNGAAVSRRGQGDSGFVAKGQDNVYAGKDGNVYKKSDSGTWQKWDSGGWNSVQKPDATPTLNAEGRAAARPEEPRVNASDAQSRQRVDSSTYNQLERDNGSRNEGAQRTRDYSNYKSSGGGARNAGSYQPSGGGRSFGGGGRGGGGGRRRG